MEPATVGSRMATIYGRTVKSERNLNEPNAMSPLGTHPIDKLRFPYSIRESMSACRCSTGRMRCCMSSTVKLET